MSDDLVFSEEQSDSTQEKKIYPWQVLVVDDDPAVHEVTKLVLAGFEMDGRPLQFSHCYSGAEAQITLAQPNDIALILLDVVMETEHAGLDLARFIRQDICNLNVRIILRTGQPGQAPEEQVIKDYDINDYKEKTDLTRRKLITVFYAGLRAYRDLMRLDRAGKGLRRSIEAIGQVYDSRDLGSFASAILEQVNFLLGINGEGLCATRVSAYTANSSNGLLKVLAATKGYSQLLVGEQVADLPSDVQTVLHETLNARESRHGNQHYAGYFRTKAGSESVIYMKLSEPIADDARELLEIFSSNLAIAYDGLLLHKGTQRAQQAAISILGAAIEKRSNAPCCHLSRMGDVAALLVQQTGGTVRDVELMRIAVALHDVGKAGIAEAILIKPGPLDADEWATMKGHAEIGHALLSQSTAPVHMLGAVIAREHHERWDGTGYPLGLQGEAISASGRIAAVADVLDSLVCASPYKKAWPLTEALAYLSAESGRHFDPNLVAILNANREAVEDIYRT